VKRSVLCAGLAIGLEFDPLPHLEDESA